MIILNGCKVIASSSLAVIEACLNRVLGLCGDGVRVESMTSTSGGVIVVIISYDGDHFRQIQELSERGVFPSLVDIF